MKNLDEHIALKIQEYADSFKKANQDPEIVNQKRD